MASGCQLSTVHANRMLIELRDAEGDGLLRYSRPDMVVLTQEPRRLARASEAAQALTAASQTAATSAQIAGSSTVVNPSPYQPTSGPPAK